MKTEFKYQGCNMIDMALLRTNQLLETLSVEELERLRPHLEPVSFRLGEVLHESGVALKHLYFPTTTVISLLFVTETGASTELATTGREGAVGIELFMGGESAPSRAVVQIEGMALRLPVDEMRNEFRRGEALQTTLLRFTQALIAQTSQTAVCNRHHNVDQQLCRWLLRSMDRTEANELRMTQQSIANMLGVRREGVTEAAGKLQSWGCINYSRGLIKILDRQRLEDRVCECYSVVNKEYGRLLHDVSGARQ